jgi:hypothetical protein
LVSLLVWNELYCKKKYCQPYFEKIICNPFKFEAVGVLSYFVFFGERKMQDGGFNPDKIHDKLDEILKTASALDRKQYSHFYLSPV